MSIELIDIKSLNKAEIKELLSELGEPAYRASQVFKWLHKGIEDFGEMSDISKALREKLREKCDLRGAAVYKRFCSAKDETKKYLLQLNDGEFVEAVLMSYKHGWSVCISTQVGCKMGCVFCATGRSGFSRDLTASEMLSQITSIQKCENIRISNVVLMGMGEPLDNFDNVLRFLELLSDPDGICIGQRHVSVSTCGLVSRINQLAEMKLQFTLSVSLHAPNDKLRSAMMPVNERWHVDELLEACRNYANATGRRISFEYSLVGGTNDSDECARELVRKLKGMLCHVNLIPVNAVEGTGCFSPSSKRTQAFLDILTSGGITATVRRTLGSDINASCGQLRRRNLAESEDNQY